MKNPRFLKSVTALALLLVLGACETTPTPRADQSIKLVPSADGKTTLAVPPECISQDVMINPWDNGVSPQHGCAQARNLALHVATPSDLLEPQDLGHPDPVLSSASIIDYRAGKSKDLLDAHAEAPTATSSTDSGKTPD